MDLYAVFFLIIILFYVYLLLYEGYKLYSDRNFFMIGVIGLFLIIILGYAGFIYFSSPHEIVVDNVTEVKDVEEDSDNVPMILTPALTTHQFVVADPKEISNTTQSEITYDQFKNLITSPLFISQFTESVKTCLSIKQKLYTKLKTQATKDLATFSKSATDDALSDMLSKMRNEQANDIKELISRIDDIMKQIDIRLKNLSVDDTKKRLYKAIYDKELGLDTLVGRDNIKEFVIQRLYAFSHNPRVFFSSFQNMALMAGPGMGKTRIAQVIGHVFSCSGILVQGNLIVTTKTGLVSPYVNESAHKTRSFLMSTLESVVVLDEIYDITPAPTLLNMSIDHGHEAITEIVNFIDKHMGLNVLCVMGYEHEMKTQFFASNKGLDRRFPHKIVLEPYSSKELTSILMKFLHSCNPNLPVPQNAVNYLYTVVNWLQTQNPNIFSSQAGDMLNMSADISNCIYNMLSQWPEQYEGILLKGVNEFLTKANKGIALIDKDMCLV